MAGRKARLRLPRGVKMGILKFASEETIKLPLDEESWVEVKKDVSKRTFNGLISAMPNREIAEDSKLTLGEGLAFQQALFEALVVNWSLGKGKPSLDDYLNLDRKAAEAVDSVLIDHFSKIEPTKDEASKAVTLRGSRRKVSGQTT